jgi:Flp pilus assembly protein TadG
MRTIRTRLRAHDPDRDRGAAMVEFALVLPILLILTLGIINFGYLFGQKLSLNQAVREGARAAVVAQGLNGTTVQEKVQSAVGGMIPAADVTATADIDCGAITGVGQQLKVTANAPTELLVPMPIPGFPTEFNLDAEAVFRCEF